MMKPTHRQMMKRPSLWYNEYLDTMRIVYPDIYTQESFTENAIEWTNEFTNSTSVIRCHFEFLGWL